MIGGVDYCIDCDAVGLPLRDGVCADCFEPWARRLRSLIRRAWSSRPIMVRRDLFKNQRIAGYVEGYNDALDRTGGPALPVPSSAEVQRHASRVTSTGRTLVALGQ
jgi:hypothetical protein